MSALIVCTATAFPAHAAEEFSLDVPPGPLNVALISFATQANVSIDASDPELRLVQVAGLRGRFSLREGLGRLLKGTGYDSRILRGDVVRVFRRPTRLVPGRRTAATSHSPRAPVDLPSPPEQIIVTASKQNVALADYPGDFHVALFDEVHSLHLGSRGSEALLRKLPNLTSTNLGSGRNKIFVRGIADSSFNGQLQSTVSQYFGESRLTYSAPDPDLALYDIEKVEVVEGPQGALYGAGSLGGVIRITPRVPVLGEYSASGTAAIGVTGKNLGGDGAMVANIPVGERAALRLVGYRIVRPGYIDDVRRGLSDVNRTTVFGVRATFRMEFNARLSMDAGIVSQDTGSKDGQYTDGPRSSALTRRSFVAQPFDNDYRLMFGTLRADLGFAKLVSNTSYTYHPIDIVFDATSPSMQVPIVFRESMQVKLLTHETRLSGSTDWISTWVSGFSFAHNINNIDRFLGPADTLAMISNVQSETLDAAVFGEATVPLWHNVSITAGGRLSFFTRFDEFNTGAGRALVEPTRRQTRFLPTAALAWKPWKAAIGYLRYQEGFRPGAEQLTGSGDQAEVSRFQPDAVRTAEIGMRFGTDDGSRLSGGLSYAYSQWSRVQADLVTNSGFPYIANLGSAKVHYVSASLGWKATSELSFDLSGFYTASHLDGPTSGSGTDVERNLPNVADSGSRLTGSFKRRIGNAKITLDGSVGYIGTSYLGVGAPFDISQGDYFDTAMGARAEFSRWGVSFDIDNLLDSRANRFSYGNPFSVADGNQRTPLRPRTIRIGIDARF
ncbi:outer membrane receptor protein involved in Fe transport [Sphingobium xenophagum]|uniref:Outer membrane receptor protein involved in Fe transport n=1 Tax=Sphingobium xenophagum TaxID=121428 RepID=A0ABU1X544_SPHXE|nr:TonB-dependent receptor [Sphingobium xenophagum]MDR7156711.1 outer membrane receptor protein involved in Fe transport [Sphingobium xenophagum]